MVALSCIGFLRHNCQGLCVYICGATWGIIRQVQCSACVPSDFSRVWLFATLWTMPARLLCLWNFPGKNTMPGVSCHALLQGIILIQGLNTCLLCLLHQQMNFLPLVARHDQIALQSRGTGHNPTTCLWVPIAVHCQIWRGGWVPELKYRPLSQIQGIMKAALSRRSCMTREYGLNLSELHAYSMKTIFCPVHFGSSVVSNPLHPHGQGGTPGLLAHHQLPEFTQTHVHQVGDAFQPSHPLSAPSPPAPNRSQHQGLFQWVSSSHEVAKVLELQLQHQSLQWIFRTDFL